MNSKINPENYNFKNQIRILCWEKVTVFKATFFIKRQGSLFMASQMIVRILLTLISWLCHIMPVSKRSSVKAWATFIPMVNHSSLLLPVL